MGPVDRFTAERLSERHRVWLAGLPTTAVIAGAILCHGTPSDDDTYLLETVDEKGIRIAPQALLESRLASTPEFLILCGHSHNPRAVAASNGRLAVNPGSVGLQADRAGLPYPHMLEVGSPHARYAIVDTGPRPRVEFIAVEYDCASASADAREAGNTAWAHALVGGYCAPE
jgi:diadenosine tetraphosphatase ApaH/serine/threonine PP2A family protein phosphatase